MKSNRCRTNSLDFQRHHLHENAATKDAVQLSSGNWCSTRCRPWSTSAKYSKQSPPARIENALKPFRQTGPVVGVLVWPPPAKFGTLSCRCCVEVRVEVLNHERTNACAWSATLCRFPVAPMRGSSEWVVVDRRK